MIKSQKRVLILGAGGYIGSACCRHFHSLGWQVYGMFYTEISEVVSAYCDGVIKADITFAHDRGRISEYIKIHEITHMVYAIGRVDYKIGFEMLYQYNVRTAQGFIKLLEDMKEESIPRTVFVSSSATRGFGSTCIKFKPLDEKVSLYRKGAAVYSDIKRLAEEEVLGALKRIDYPVIIVQPGSLVGSSPRGTTTNNSLMMNILKGRPVLSGGASYSSVNQVAQGVAMALEKGEAGHFYILGGENMTMKDFAHLVRSVAKASFPDLKRSRLPIFVLKPVAAALASIVSDNLTHEMVILGTSCHYVSSSKAQGILGYSHSADDLKSAIIEVLEEM